MRLLVIPLILLLLVGRTQQPENCLDWCLYRLNWQRADLVRTDTPEYPCICSLVIGEQDGKIIRHAVIVWAASADSLRISDEARSPEGAMAKMLLSGKGWLIVS